MDDLKKKLKTLKDRYFALYNANKPSLKDQKTITCPVCGSRINVKYITGYTCPVCNYDRKDKDGKINGEQLDTSYRAFMSATLKARLEPMEKEMKELENQMRKE